MIGYTSEKEETRRTVSYTELDNIMRDNVHKTLGTRAGSLNHFSGEPNRGAPNFSQSQRGIS